MSFVIKLSVVCVCVCVCVCVRACVCVQIAKAVRTPAWCGFNRPSGLPQSDRETPMPRGEGACK
jgi:hypothetical protein